MVFLSPMTAAIGIYGNITGLFTVFLSWALAVVRPSGVALKTCGGTYTDLCIFAAVLLSFQAVGKMSMLTFWHRLAFAEQGG